MTDYYSELTKYGKKYAFNFKADLSNVIYQINKYNDKWAQYNPRKTINRQGLSLTSLDGTMGAGPDLDSLYEYNSLNGTKYNELSFKEFTPLYKDCFGNTFEDIEPFIGRSHIIKLPPGGYFPIHRDSRLGQVTSTFRLILPIQNCNPPKMYFMLEDNIIHFDHGKFYFVDTCLEHTLFNSSLGSDSIFAVFNVSIEAVPYLGRWLTVR